MHGSCFFSSDWAPKIHLTAYRQYKRREAPYTHKSISTNFSIPPQLPTMFTSPAVIALFALVASTADAKRHTLRDSRGGSIDQKVRSMIQSNFVQWHESFCECVWKLALVSIDANVMLPPPPFALNLCTKTWNFFHLSRSQTTFTETGPPALRHICLRIRQEQQEKQGRQGHERPPAPPCRRDGPGRRRGELRFCLGPL